MSEDGRGAGAASAPVATEASRVQLSRIMHALDVNLHGNAHGGVIMRMVDEAAGAVAARDG